MKIRHRDRIATENMPRRTTKCTGVAVAGRFQVDGQLPPPRDFKRYPTEIFSFSMPRDA